MAITSNKYCSMPSFVAQPKQYAFPMTDVLKKRDGREERRGASSNVGVPAKSHSHHHDQAVPRSLRAGGAWESSRVDSNAKLPFPDPPTLADIQRMEPDLSPASMRRRASDVDDRPSAQELVDDAMGEEGSDVSMSPPSYRNEEFYLDRPVIEDSSPIIYTAALQDRGDCRGDLGLAADRNSVLPAYKPFDQGDYEFTTTQEGYKSLFDTPSPEASPAVSEGSTQVDAGHDQKALENFAFAEWVVSYMYDFVMMGQLPNEDSTARIAVWRNFRAFQIAVDNVWHILQAMSFPRSAIILALWYATRLHASHRSSVSPRDIPRCKLQSVLLDDGRALIEDRVIRSFVLGLMLADKWVDDHTFLIKTWHEVTDIPLAILRDMESNALAILDYRLAITSTEWQCWLDHIQYWHLDLASHCFTDESHRAIMDDILDDVCITTRESIDPNAPIEPHFLGIRQNITANQAPNDAWGLHTSAPECPDLPSPSEWFPERDPVIYRTQPRTTGVAPGMHNHSSLTAQDIVSAMMAGVPVTLVPPGLGAPTLQNATMMGPFYTQDERRGYPVANVHTVPSWGAAPVY